MHRLAIVTVLTLAGCGLTRTYVLPRPHRTHVQGVEDRDLYVASVQTLASLGYALRETIPEAGVVSSEWQPVESIGRRAAYHAWRVVVAEGQIRVSIDCYETFNLVQEQCSAERAEEWVLNGAPQLEEQIIQRAHALAAAQRQTPVATGP